MVNGFNVYFHFNNYSIHDVKYVMETKRKKIRFLIDLGKILLLNHKL